MRQDAAKPVHPAMCSLYDPASRFETSLMFNRLCFFAARANMSRIAKFFHQVSYLTRIIPFIKTHALFFSLSRLWPFYWNTFYRRLCQFAIMSICSVNRQATRDSGTVGQQTAFNAFFGPVRRVWAGFFPRPAGLWSWRHPSIATTSQSLSTHHNRPELWPTVSEKSQLLPISEIVSAPCCWNQYRFRSMHSIGSRFAIRKIFHPWLCDPVLSACRRRNGACLNAWVSTARFFPITHLKFYNGFLLFVFSSLNPFKGLIASDYISYSGVIRIGSYSVAPMGLKKLKK